jgi:hypothetical protein
MTLNPVTRRWVAILYFGLLGVSMYLHILTFFDENSGRLLPLGIVGLCLMIPGMLLIQLELHGFKILGRRKVARKQLLASVPCSIQVLVRLFSFLSFLSCMTAFLSFFGESVTQKLNEEYTRFFDNSGSGIFVSPDDMPNTSTENLDRFLAEQSSNNIFNIYTQTRNATYNSSRTGFLRFGTGVSNIILIHHALYFWFPRKNQKRDNSAFFENPAPKDENKYA